MYIVRYPGWEYNNVVDVETLTKIDNIEEAWYIEAGIYTWRTTKDRLKAVEA